MRSRAAVGCRAVLTASVATAALVSPAHAYQTRTIELPLLANQWASALAVAAHAPASYALAAIDANQMERAAKAIIKLRALARRGSDTDYWPMETHTPFYGWGLAGDVETTALAVQALTLAAGKEQKNPRHRERSIWAAGRPGHFFAKREVVPATRTWKISNANQQRYRRHRD